MVRTVLQVGFWLATAGWYWLLVRPGLQEVADAVAGWDHLLIYLAQKGLHFGMYAGLAVGAVALFPRWRWWVLGVVMAHGIVSELGQYFGNLWFDTHRSGDPVDVLIDWAGVSVGVGGWWVVKSLTPHPPSPSPSGEGVPGSHPRSA